MVYLTIGPRVLFLPFSCITERLLTEGCAVQAPESGGVHLGSALESQRENGRRKEGRGQGISSPHSLPETASPKTTVSPLGLQLLLERTVEPSASAGWPWFQGCTINISIFCPYSSGISCSSWVPGCLVFSICLHIFFFACVINTLPYSPSV